LARRLPVEGVRQVGQRTLRTVHQHERHVDRGGRFTLGHDCRRAPRQRVSDELVAVTVGLAYRDEQLTGLQTAGVKGDALNGSVGGAKEAVRDGGGNGVE